MVEKVLGVVGFYCNIEIKRFLSSFNCHDLDNIFIVDNLVVYYFRVFRGA